MCSSEQNCQTLSSTFRGQNPKGLCVEPKEANRLAFRSAHRKAVWICFGALGDVQGDDRDSDLDIDPAEICLESVVPLPIRL